MPGGATGIGAMADAEGNITDDPKKIGDLLCQHWTKVFGRVEIDRGILDTWLYEEFGTASNNSKVESSKKKNTWKPKK